MAENRPSQTPTIFAQGGSPKVRQLRQYVDQRLVAMRVDRWSWWQHWRQLSDFILPRRGRYLMTPNQATRGDPVGSPDHQRDSDFCASGRFPRGSWRDLPARRGPGFGYRSGTWTCHDNTPVRLWLDEVTKRILAVLSQSNAYNSLHVIYEELGCFGTG